MRCVGPSVVLLSPIVLIFPRHCSLAAGGGGGAEAQNKCVHLQSASKGRGGVGRLGLAKAPNAPTPTPPTRGSLSNGLPPKCVFPLLPHQI